MDIKFKRYFEVQEGTRLFEMLVNHRRFMANIFGSWGEKFKTKTYERKIKTLKIMRDHIHIIIGRMDHGFATWKWVSTGSDRYMDVVARKKQSFEIHEYMKEKVIGFDLNVIEIDSSKVPEKYALAGSHYFSLRPTSNEHVAYWHKWLEENLTSYERIGEWDVRVDSQQDAVMIKMTWC